jgi:hypothetical protein
MSRLLDHAEMSLALAKLIQRHDDRYDNVDAEPEDIVRDFIMGPTQVDPPNAVEA